MYRIHYSDSSTLSTNATNPLVLIHGFCETHELWQNFQRKLSGSIRVICPDLPGFGQSHLPNSHISIPAIAEAIYQWLNSMHINKCCVIGHSMGGYITLALAKKHPELLHSIGLFHSTAYEDSQGKKENRTKTIEFVETHGVKKFTESFVPALFSEESKAKLKNIVNKTEAMASKTNKESLIAYTKAMRDRESCIDVLTNFHEPILFIAGEKDMAIPPEHSRAQAVLSDRIQFHLLKDTGHMGMLEKEDDAVNIVRDFCTADL